MHRVREFWQIRTSLQKGTIYFCQEYQLLWLMQSQQIVIYDNWSYSILWKSLSETWLLPATLSNPPQSGASARTGLGKGKTTTQAKDQWGKSVIKSLRTPVKVGEQEGELVLPEERHAFIISATKVYFNWKKLDQFFLGQTWFACNSNW